MVAIEAGVFLKASNEEEKKRDENKILTYFYVFDVNSKNLRELPPPIFGGITSIKNKKNTEISLTRGGRGGGGCSDNKSKFP